MAFICAISTLYVLVRFGDFAAEFDADTAARLGVYFGMEAEFWLNLQAHYDLALTREALAGNLAAAA